MSDPTFQGIKGGDIVTFMRYAGRGLNGPEYKVSRAKASPLLLFPTHVVVEGGMGQVVNESNYISHRTPNPRSK
jgi:hypothetical protein